MCSSAELPAADNRQPALPPAAPKTKRYSAPRRRKEALLPQINDLSLEGHSCREIASRLNLSKTTVSNWLFDLRRDGRDKAIDSTELTAVAVARYDTIYRESMEAWRTSKADKEVRLVEDTEAAGNGTAKKKQSVRTERRAGEIAFLAQARSAVDAICKLVPPDRYNQLLRKKADHMTPEEIDEFVELVEAKNEEYEQERLERQRHQKLTQPSSPK
jgi:hypothetical protein